MPVEPAILIYQLDPSYPEYDDFVSEGDDHLRAIKGALKNNLPNVRGVVTATHDDLNSIPNKAGLNNPAFVGGTTTTAAESAAGGELMNAEWVRRYIASVALGGVVVASPPIDGPILLPPTYSANVVTLAGATYLKTGVVAGGALYPAAERIYHQTITAITAPPSTYSAGGKGAYNGSKFVLARNGSTTVDLWDGASWTTGTLAYTPTGTPGIVWEPVAGLFCAVGGITGSSNAATSPDGTTWTLRALPSAVSWNSNLFYGNGRLVAFVTSTTTAAYSTNGGQSWVAATLPSGAPWSAGDYGGGAHVIIAGGTTSGTRSTDGGATWAAITLPASFTSIFGVNGFLVGFNGATGYVSSDGGLNWTQVTLPATPLSVGGIVFANGVYVLTSASTSTYTATSLLPDPDTGHSPWGISRVTAQAVNNAVAGTTSVLTLQNTGPSASSLALDPSGFVGSVTNTTATVGGLGAHAYYKRVA